jgi:hypothetical protein
MYIIYNYNIYAIQKYYIRFALMMHKMIVKNQSMEQRTIDYFFILFYTFYNVFK